MIKFVGRLLLVSLATSLLAAGYVAAPLYTAWTIREAVRSNDSLYLERKIAWTSVRATLKGSLHRYAITSDAQLASPTDKPTWWQQTRAWFGRGAVDRFVETTVTPTGLHAALTARQKYQAAFEPAEDPTKAESVIDRALQVWARVTRAEFTRADRLELEMVDEYERERTIAAVLELRDFEWILTELRIRPTDKDAAAKLELAQRN